jgi:outer membrane protein TolC
MKRFYILILSALSVAAHGQTEKPLSLVDCYKLAEANYPLVKQRELIQLSKAYSVENIGKGMLPQIAINGQATYQSDVTQIPISIPGMNIQSIPKDQYKIYGEITQPLTDLTTIRQQKQLQETNSTIQERNLEVELYKLKERINQLFFGMLLIDGQLAQNELLKKDIENGMNKVNAAISNGLELKTSLNKLKAELLKANQRSIELKSSRKAYADMLALFIHQPVDEQTKLEKPITVAPASSINRPELAVFDFQQKGYQVQSKLISIKNLPRVNFFFQGGLGQPSPVNMLSRDLSTYYLTGLRLNWNISGYYTYKRDKQINAINMDLIGAQRETFIFNTSLTLRQQNAEVTKLQELITSDKEIVALRENVKTASSAQLENGVITANDYLKEINAEDQARQALALHEIQLLVAQYNYQTTSGN